MPSYIAIDLKSFYASVECVERGLDPLKTNLLVADVSRTDKTICLAVSPSLKAYGISGRARLFEARQRIEEVNYERRLKAPQYELRGKSYDDDELKQHPDWAVSYIAAPPRMSFYMQYSAKVYGVYLKYIAPEDILVYSIDEVFIDVTKYLKTYKKTPHEMAMMMVKDVLKTTGITATAGIGTNMFLCKVAMDIVAKHMPADADGVRVAELDEMTFRKTLWDHKPITDFWRVGKGIARRLEALGVNTMGMVARLSHQNEDLLYRVFGVNAELLIDHAWGWEPCTIADAKAYKPSTNSLSSGQVLTCPYTYEKARVVVREMVDTVVYRLLERKMLTNHLVLYVCYDRESLENKEIRDKYEGPIGIDYYGREVPVHAQGTCRLKQHTSSARIIAEGIMNVFDSIVNRSLLIRRLNISANNVVSEDFVQKSNQSAAPIQLDLFTDYAAQQEEQKKEDEELAKERRLQETLLNIRNRFGKNAMLKGLNFSEGATARERNAQIGGHKA